MITKMSNLIAIEIDFITSKDQISVDMISLYIRRKRSDNIDREIKSNSLDLHLPESCENKFNNFYLLIQ